MNTYTLRNSHTLTITKRVRPGLYAPYIHWIVNEQDPDGHYLGTPYCSLNENSARQWVASAVRRGHGLTEYALPEDSPAFRRALAEADLSTRRPTDDGLRLMLVPDRSDAFTRSGRSLISDPIRIPEPVARQTSIEMTKLARVRDRVRARRAREARVAAEAREGIAVLQDWLAGGEDARS